MRQEDSRSKPTDEQLLSLAQSAIAEGNISTLNQFLADLQKIPEETRLELLAQGYDRRAEIFGGMSEKAHSEVVAAYFVPPWELDEISARTTAAELRTRAKNSRKKETINGLWRQQRDEAMRFVKVFGAKHDDRPLQSGIDKGLAVLVGDLVRPFELREAQERSSSYDYPTIKTALSAYLESCLPEIPPSNIFLSGNGDLGHIGSFNRETSPLPRHVIYIGERYGFADGIQKGSAEVARLHQVKPNTVHQGIETALRRIRGVKEIRRLLFK